MLPRFVLLPGIIVLACAVPPAAAQADVSPPAHVAWVEGQVLVEREAVREDLTGPTPLLPGERVRTDGGRAEVLFGDGTLLQLDDRTTIDVLADDLVRLIEGRLMLVVGSGGAGRVQIDTPGGSVHAQTAGEYRLTVFHEGGVPMIELATIRGSAEVFTNEGSTTVAAGQRAWAREGEVPSYAQPFNSAHWDAFDRWSQERLGARRGVQSARHVPAPLHSYAGVLDTHGYWAHQPAYGQVWFPRVSHGWRPYYHGRWRFYARFGWTWIGADVWSWPTHHYGRWGVTPAGAWFWIPGRQWGPAWVHWAVAPGYVSWCPLGFDNRPVFAFWRPGHRSWAHARWSHWTVVARHHFGSFVHVNRHALDGRYFAGRAAAPAFVVQQRAPDRSFAVARQSFVPEPRVAVRRGTAAPLAAAGSGRGGAGQARAGRTPPEAATSAAGTPATRSTPGVRTNPATRSASGGRAAVADAPAERRLRAGAPLTRQPDAAADGAASPPGARTAVPRRSGGTSAPGAAAPVRRDVAPAQPADAAAAPAVTAPPPGRAPEQPRRAATPRGDGGSRVWSPDQVPVHRGTAPARAASPRTGSPERAAPSPGAAPGPQSYEAPAPRRAAPGYAAPPRTPDGDGRAAPRGDGGQRRAAPPPSYAPPPRSEGGDGGRASAPRAVPRGGSSGSSRATPPAAAAPPSSPPPAAAAPARSGGSRQAPDGGGSGRATPRGGGSRR